MTRLSVLNGAHLKRPSEGAGSSGSGVFAAVRHAEKFGTPLPLRKCARSLPTPVQYGERIRAARETLGWSQDRLARVWGCARPTVIGWEKGRALAPVTVIEWIEELAAELKVGT